MMQRSREICMVGLPKDCRIDKLETGLRIAANDTDEDFSAFPDHISGTSDSPAEIGSDS